jgi:dUTP pyrophosphatase
MNIKIKKLSENAFIPSYQKEGDAGMDLVATSKMFDEEGCVVYGTGLAMEIPIGFVGLIFPRSSNSKKDLVLSNSVGVIDCGYRGEIMLKFKPLSFFATDADVKVDKHLETFEYICVGKEDIEDDIEMELYNIGDRIGQIIIMPFPKVHFEEVKELSESERGTKGYGSTGK